MSNPKLLVFLESGICQGIMGDQPVDVFVINRDISAGPPENVVEVMGSPAAVSREEVIIDSNTVTSISDELDTLI